MELDKLKRDLESIIDVESIKYNEPMKNHTSFKVGGPADIFVLPHNKNEIVKVIKILKDYKTPFIVIGNGSNLIVKDGGLRGAVICLTGLNKVYTNEVKLYAEGGVLLSSASNEALRNSLKGFEFASGIPGTIGGAVTMNAGAYGPEVKDVILSAEVMDLEGNIYELNCEELEFSYRSSVIQRNNLIVLSAVFNLESGDYEIIKNRMDELNTRRRDKQPLAFPSAGSTFKRPEGHFAAKLIEDSGLKGARIGGAMVSEKHSGFIINYEDSTARDILNLISEVKARIKEKYDIVLETEVKIIGED